MRYLCMVLLLLGYRFPLNAQTPYSLSLGYDVPIIVGSVGLGYGITRLEHKLDGLSEEFVNSRKPEQIWKFDRISTRNWRPKTAKISDQFLKGAIVLPFTLIAAKEIREDYATFATLGVQTFAVNGLLTLITKYTAKRVRPFVYNSDPRIPLPLKMSRKARSSFFSGHTSFTAAMTVLFAKGFTDTYPDSKANPYIWASAALIPTGVAFMRVHAGRHFITDVLVGFVVGSAVGFLVPQLHR